MVQGLDYVNNVDIFNYGDICVDECPFGNYTPNECIQRIPETIFITGKSLSETSVLLDWSNYTNTLINTFYIYINDNLNYTLSANDDFYYYDKIPTILQINNLDYGTTYNFSVIAENEIGKSLRSNYLQLQTFTTTSSST